MNEQTIEKMRTMKLFGMVRAFRTSLQSGKSEKCTADEFLGMLIDSEWDDRYNRKLDRSVRNARFRYKAAVEQINFTDHRVAIKNQVLDWLTVTLLLRRRTSSLPVARALVKVTLPLLSAIRHAR